MSSQEDSDGQLLRREDYPGLYEAIVRAFGGGEDAGTFCLPDLRDSIADQEQRDQ